MGSLCLSLAAAKNNRLIHEALAGVFAEHQYPYNHPFYFPTIGEYASRLESAGFRVIYAILFDRMTELKGENGLKDWIHMFVKTPFSVVKSKAEQEVMIDAAVKRLQEKLYRNGKWYSDYVRLRMKAVKE